MPENPELLFMTSDHFEWKKNLNRKKDLKGKRITGAGTGAGHGRLGARIAYKTNLLLYNLNT